MAALYALAAIRNAAHNMNVILRNAMLAVATMLLHAQDPFTAQRERMVRDQIASRDVRDPAVLKAMRETPRHLFVPEALRKNAYEDHPLPIGLGQTISQPYIVAFMTELLDVKATHRVLEVGTGSGYQAAILSRLAREVYTIEIVAEHAKTASGTLKRLGYKNVVVTAGDGYEGWPAHAPFDRIMLTAAPPAIPDALLRQLKPGGKLIAPVGRTTLEQQIVLVDKAADGTITSRSLLPVRFVPMVKPAAR